MNKIRSRQELVHWVTELRSKTDKNPPRVGYTSGVFDLLHAGHVMYLTKAKEHCDILIVGVNADSSVKRLKGEQRPINSERDRAEVIAALEAVDGVFLFEEENNNTNVECLRPDCYLKAGDYKKEQLSSTPLVESYGGQVVIIPFRDGRSTTGAIEKIVSQYGMQIATFNEKEPYEKRPAVFLDRDGTICKHVDYLHEPEKFEFLPGALEGMKLLQENGYRLVIITNQPGIGLGYFTKEDLFRVNHAMLKGCGAAGVMIDKIYFSPYSQADGTPCRKPGTALVERAVSELHIDLPASYVIGDMTSDIQLAANVGCSSALVRTGKGGQDGLFECEPDLVGDSLVDVARQIAQK